MRSMSNARSLRAPDPWSISKGPPSSRSSRATPGIAGQQRRSSASACGPSNTASKNMEWPAGTESRNGLLSFASKHPGS